MTAMPSTPIFSNSRASRMVSKVAGIPALTMTRALPADLVDHLAAEPHLLLEGQRGEIAVGAGAHDVVAGRDLPAHLRPGGGVVHGLVVVEAGDEGDEGFLGHGSLPAQ